MSAMFTEVTTRWAEKLDQVPKHDGQRKDFKSKPITQNFSHLLNWIVKQHVAWQSTLCFKAMKSLPYSAAQEITVFWGIIRMQRINILSHLFDNNYEFVLIRRLKAVSITHHPTEISLSLLLWSQSLTPYKEFKVTFGFNWDIHMQIIHRPGE